jgi:hypothetical protein
VGKKSEKSSGKGKGKKLFRLLIGLVVIAAVLEFGGRFEASRLAENALETTGGAESADVTIGAQIWRPALLPALAGKPLDQLSAELVNVKVGPLNVDQINYELNDVVVDLDLSKRPVHLTSIGSGQVMMQIASGSLAAVLGTAVEITGGQVLVGPNRQKADLTVSGGQLTVRVAETGRTFEPLPVDDPDLLPCPPTVAVTNERVVLACTGNRLPGIVKRSLDPLRTDVPVRKGADVAPPASTPTRSGG